MRETVMENPMCVCLYCFPFPFQGEGWGVERIKICLVIKKYTKYTPAP